MPVGSSKKIFNNTSLNVSLFFKINNNFWKVITKCFRFLVLKEAIIKSDLPTLSIYNYCNFYGQGRQLGKVKQKTIKIECFMQLIEINFELV